MPSSRLLLMTALLSLGACSDDPKGGSAAPADPGEGPSVTLSGPVEDGPWYSDQPIALSGRVSDAEDAPYQLSLRWSTEAGELAVETAVTEAGELSASGLLGEGSWTLSLEVTDSDGNTAVDSLPLTVGGPNQAPACQITSPADGLVVAVGEELRFEGEASDPEVDMDRLAVRWASDVVGELSTDPPAADGLLSFATDSLPAGSHLVELTVADEVGATCTDQVSMTVSTPPSVTLHTPAEGERVNAGTAVSFTATVGDAEDPPEALAVVWVSSLDGELSRAGADAEGALALSVDDLQPGLHDIELTVTDTDGLMASAQLSLSVNALPTAPTVTLSPDPATTTDDLLVLAEGSVDPDSSGELTYDYAWTEDGVALSETSATLPASATAKGRLYRVTVTPSDDLGSGAAGAAELVVANSAPVLSGPSLSASSVQVGDRLTCAATATDVDPSDRPTVAYTWSDGSTGSTYTVLESDNPGDVLSCIATAEDGDGGVATGTASATVLNTAPVVSSVTVSPTTARVGETLTCGGTATDADGGSPTVTYAWSDGSTGATYLLAESDNPGDAVTCTATATDTDGGVATGTASATVLNTDPQLGPVLISPSSATNDDTLSCSTTATDADGGSPSVTTSWTGSLAGSLGSGPSLDLSMTAAASGELLTCTATASDTDGGSATSTATLTLDNRDPTLSVTLTPSGAAREDTLTCTATATDADGDSVTTSFSWTVDGSSTAATSSSASQSTLAGAFSKGQTVLCAATTSDGKGGSASDSASAAILNTPPPAPGVAIAPSEPVEGEALVCGITPAADVDGDSVSYTLSWTVDGAAFSDTLTGSWSGDTVAGSSVGVGETWVCTATPNDGSADGSTASDSVLIAEREPVTLSLSEADYVLTGDSAYDYAGHSVAFVGDVDADGLDDFLIGAHGGDDATNESGTTYLFLGGSLGSSSTLATGDADLQIYGENTQDMAGLRVAGAGDVDGDGLADLLIGARNNAENGTRSGKAYLVLGGSLSGLSTLGLGDADAGFAGESGNDQAGQGVASAGDVNDDGFDDVLVGAPYDDAGAGDAGKVYLILGSSSVGGTGSVDLTAADLMLLGEDSSDLAGFSVGGAGDVDGDGLDDLLVGAYGAGTSSVGKAYVVLGDSLSSSGSIDLSTADHAFVGEGSSDAAGHSVASAGDVDEDGLDDILVGAPYNDDGGDQAGKAYLILGGSLSGVGSLDLDSADSIFAGEEEDQWTGRSVAPAGDVDGDGLADILVGAPFDNDALDPGSAHLFLGLSLDAGGSFVVSEADYILAGEDAGDVAGESVSGAGDVNGDGLDDVLVGAWQNNDGGLVAGKAYLQLFGD